MNTKREKIYVISNPKLMKEWDWEKNNILGFTPDKTTIGSAKKVWWKCEMGHSWQSTVNHRSSGKNCPNCAQIQRTATRLQRFLDDNKSLAAVNPTLALQWHPTANEGLTPNDVMANSGKKAWWLCDKGHKWDAVIKSRNHGSNCPICSGHKILVGYNDLATVNPKLAQQWHPTKNGELKPTDVTISNGRKFWWLCDLNHSWASTVANRNSGTGCPYCSNKKVLVGFNDLATTHPELATQWHPTNNKSLTPQQITAGANIKVWWRCEMGHSWKSTISHRKQGKGCPKCADEHKTSFPEQSIFFYLKQVAFAKNRHILDNRTELDIFLPDYNIGIEYDGEFYHSGEKSQQREKRKEDKLKNLGITLIRVKETRTLSTIQSQNIIFSPSHPTEKQLNETIDKLITHINNLVNSNLSIDIDVSRDRNKIHEQYILNEKENSLLNTHPHLAEEWHPTKNGVILPEHVRAGSNKKAWWLCKKGHEWDAVINSRRKGIGCPICSGRKVLPGYNDLATLLPDIAKEWHPTKNGDLKPSAVTKNSNIKVWWRCKNNHVWQATISSRNTGCGCPYCYNEKRKKK